MGRRIICENPNCNREVGTLNLFEGKWYCLFCWSKLQRQRDNEYYENLRKELRNEGK